MTNRLLTNTPKTTRRVYVAGANRGARGNLPALARLNRESERMAIEVVPVDPVPGRAMALATEARGLGLTATATEGKIEEIVTTPTYRGEPKILNLDRAGAIAVALAATEKAAPPVLFYLIIVLPSGRMAGLRGAIAPEETRFRTQAKNLFDALAKVSERVGGRSVWGPGANPAHLALEPELRAKFFAAHCQQNLAKLLAGLEIESPPFEIGFDPAEPIPLHVVERDSWGVPYEVVEAVAENPEMPIARGQKFVVAEVTPAGVRLHESTCRSYDEKVIVEGTSTIDEHSMIEAAETAARVVEELRAAQAAQAAAAERAAKERVPTPAAPPSNVAVREMELAREASILFSTAVRGSERRQSAAPPVRTNEITKRSPIITTD